MDQATWGVQENSWRAGLLDDKGKIRYGWGNVAKTFGEDPRWTDYITEVRCGDNPSLTWEQYVDALITRDGRTIYPNGHEERQWQRGKRSQEPQSQTPRPQAKAVAASKLPYGQTSKKAFKAQEHKRAMALSLEKQSTIASMARYAEELQKQKVEEDNRRAMAKRWTDNHGEKAASTPHLPQEMWDRILQEGPDERAQLAAWVAWANSTLLQLVVVWFRTGGQRDSRWLGRLINEKGNITTRDTDNIAKRLAPWCKAILQPGSQNDLLHYEGNENAPANFVNVYTHMLSMMKYLGFDNVIDTGDSLASDLETDRLQARIGNGPRPDLRLRLGHCQFHFEAVGQDRLRSRSSVQTLVRSHNIKSTHRRPLVIPPRFDKGLSKWLYESRA